MYYLMFYEKIGLYIKYIRFSITIVFVIVADLVPTTVKIGTCSFY